MATIRKGVKELVEEANAAIRCVSVEEAIALRDEADVVIVDVRDIRERQRDGFIPGSYHAPRGMLEFWVDPASPYFKEIFASGKHFVFHCASGWRSALATRAVQEMGLEPVSHIEGGFGAWRKSGGPIERTPDGREPRRS
jgi:rhodanese-related sulfurtransferase